MKNFADLCIELDQSITTNEKVLILSDYLRIAPAEDKLWAIELLLGTRPKRVITTAILKDWAVQNIELPDWLVEESIERVGNVTEAISLLLAKPLSQNHPTLSQCLLLLKSMKGTDEMPKRKLIEQIWTSLHAQGQYVFNRLLTGGFRMKLSRKIVSQALAQVTGVEEFKLNNRLIGKWNATDTSYSDLVDRDQESDIFSRPYRFHLTGKSREQKELGAPEDWEAALDWEGIRCQLICRGHHIFLWSATEEMVTDLFPEFCCLHDRLPDGTVIEGTIVGGLNGEIFPRDRVKARLNKTGLSKKGIAAHPVYFVAHDLLEEDGQDIRSSTFTQRRASLESLMELVKSDAIRISEFISFDSWEELQKKRKSISNLSRKGLVLRRCASSYRSGRNSGDWWKWKPIPFTISSVLLYVQDGLGGKANVFKEFTVAVWREDELLTITRLNVDITNEELLLIKEFVAENTIDKFGPVRAVVPKLVFEIEFEGVEISRRHKSGITLRSPRLLRWNRNKSAKEANHLKDLMSLVERGSNFEIRI